MAAPVTFDPKELESKVKAMYRSVAENPHGEFHFEMGRAMAERLGYAPADLDRIPKEAIESFAGVGYYFHLADLKEGETALDLGSGSGMDTFIAALKVGPRGKVIGHCHRGSAARNHRVQLDAMGRLHWRSRPARQLSRPNCSSRHEGGQSRGQSELPVTRVAPARNSA
jgi:protein-L-isoaspartate O-methyltransferase